MNKELHPANGARKFIMEALEEVQRDPELLKKLENLTSTLAKAQGRLFQAEKKEPSSQECIELMMKAREYLAQALGLMQDLKIESKVKEVASKNIAQALAILFKATKDKDKKPVTIQEDKKKETKEKPASTYDRKVPLKTIQLNIDTKLGLDSETHFYTGFSENITEGGIFVATFNLAPIGSKILVSFTLPDGHQVTARGRVQWIREYNPAHPDQVPGMGIKFTDLLPKDKEAIERYLKSRPPIFYDDEL